MLVNTDIGTNKEVYLDSAGSIAIYPDAYQLDAADVHDAQETYQNILREQASIKVSFLKIGAYLNAFEERRLYLGLGLPSMRAFLSSDQIEISYRLAHDLMRIAKELAPRIGADNIAKIPMSTLRELLPMLSDGSSDDDIMELVDDVQPLSTRDAKALIRERRGVDEGNPPVIFFANVSVGGVYNEVSITRAGEDGDIYEVGKLRIKPEDFKHWQSRFSSFIDYKDA